MPAFARPPQHDLGLNPSPLGNVSSLVCHLARGVKCLKLNSWSLKIHPGYQPTGEECRLPYRQKLGRRKQALLIMPITLGLLLPAAPVMAHTTPTPSPAASPAPIADEVGRIAQAERNSRQKADTCAAKSKASEPTSICVRTKRVDSRSAQTAASLPRPSEMPDWCDDRGPDNQWTSNRFLACKYGQTEYEIRRDNKIVGTALIDVWDLVTVKVGDHLISHKQWMAAANFTGIGEGLYLNGVWGRCQGLCNAKSNTWAQYPTFTKTSYLHGEIAHEASVAREGQVAHAIYVDAEMEVGHPATTGFESAISELTTPIRCDFKAVTGVGIAYRACAFSTFWPTLSVPRSILPKYAGHIADAQQSGHPGAAGTPWPLHRTTDGDDIDENRNLSCADAPSPRPNGMECDEYPFASTQEGPYTSGNDSSWRLIPKQENRDGGGQLQDFYRDARILNKDAFYVKIIP